MNYGSHPFNLFLRFILEMATLFVVAYWGWTTFTAWLQYLTAIGLPVLLAAIWGIFAVPNDPSRSGKTLVATVGWVRLIIELLFFGFGAWTLHDAGFQKFALLFGLIVAAHYAASYDRIIWLLKQ